MSTKSILITGTSQGFGRASAIALAREGHTVYATMRGVDAKNKTAASELRALAQDDDLALHVLELDVTNDASVQSAVDEAGRIDVLVNNAGVGTFGMVEAFNIEQTERIFDVNVMGVLRMNRAVLPQMRERGSGLVIYISSGLGRFLFPFVGVYSSSKWTLEALAETASYELSPLGIETVIIQPGAYGTDFGANMMSAGDQERFASYGPVVQMAEGMMERFAESTNFGDPSEVRDAIVDVINMSDGQRPLRLPVGNDAVAMAGPINDAAAAVQQQIHQMMGA